MYFRYNQTHLTIHEAVQEDIDAFVYPPDVTSIDFQYCYIQTLENLPSQVTQLTFPRSAVRKVVIPESTIFIDCSENYLTELVVPPAMKWIFGNENHFKTVRPLEPINGCPNLERFNIECNRLLEHLEIRPTDKLREAILDWNQPCIWDDWHNARRRLRIVNYCEKPTDEMLKMLDERVIGKLPSDEYDRLA